MRSFSSMVVTVGWPRVSLLRWTWLMLSSTLVDSKEEW
jgi:hypothetical protein